MMKFTVMKLKDLGFEEDRIYVSSCSAVSTHWVLILITSPTAAHAISKGAHHSGISLWKKSLIDSYKEDRQKE
jgi:multisubunit Na+/H+ antiporter MnhG subunit